MIRTPIQYPARVYFSKDVPGLIQRFADGLAKFDGAALGSKFIRGIKLSRNQGHQSALPAGLMSAEGDMLVSIDADLQDDIDAIDGCIRSSTTSDIMWCQILGEEFLFEFSYIRIGNAYYTANCVTDIRSQYGLTLTHYEYRKSFDV